jgi:hypothetical protein
MVDEAEQNIIDPDPGLLFRCGNEAAVSRIALSKTTELALQASHQGYSRFNVEHHRTVRLQEYSLLLIDELRGVKEHLINLRFIVGPDWSVSSEMMSGERVSCVIAGPRRITLRCDAASLLLLHVTPTQISREYGAVLPATCVRIRTTAHLPAKLQTEVRWN